MEAGRDAGLHALVWLESRAIRVRRQVRRTRRQLFWIGLDLLHHNVRWPFPIGDPVPSRPDRGDFRRLCRAARRDSQLPICYSDRRARLGASNVASVDQRDLAANPADTSPCAFADERAQFVILKVITEYVAIGRGVAVGDAGHGAVEYDRGDGAALPIAVRAHARQYPPQARRR